MAEFPAMELFVKGAAEKILDDYVFNGKTIREWAMLLLSGDAVEVVRCKDCLHRKEKTCFNPSAGMWVGVELKDGDFCSYGERRADV